MKVLGVQGYFSEFLELSSLVQGVPGPGRGSGGRKEGGGGGVREGTYEGLR